MTNERNKCEVRDGRHVEPCATLEKATDRRAGEGNRKGLVVWPLVNMETREPSRTIFGAKTDEYPKGIIFNFCPFCGTQIDGPAKEAQQ